VPYLVPLDNRALLGEVSAQGDGAAIAALIDHLRSSPYLEQRGAMRVLVYPDAIEQVPAPFISSMSQSGLAYLASISFLATGRSADLDLAREVLESFRVSIEQGGLRSDEGPGAWYEEYATPALPKEKRLFVLNGFVYALHNLAKMLSMGMDAYLPELPEIYAQGLVGLREALPQYETTFGWSYYDRTGENRATAAYHSFQTLLIRDLGCRDNDPILLGTADRWWDMYKQKMPFWLFRSDPASTQITYAHHGVLFRPPDRPGLAPGARPSQPLTSSIDTRTMPALAAKGVCPVTFRVSRRRLTALALSALLLVGGCSASEVQSIGFGTGGSGCDLTDVASTFAAGVIVRMVATFSPLPSSVTVSTTKDGLHFDGPTTVKLDGSQNCVSGSLPNLPSGHYKTVISTIPPSQMPALTGEFDVTP
jgi:D-glucuronyl C5-epimerase C-terminus